MKRPGKITVLIFHPVLSVSKRRRFSFSSFFPGFRFMRLTAWVTGVECPIPGISAIPRNDTAVCYLGN